MKKELKGFVVGVLATVMMVGAVPVLAKSVKEKIDVEFNNIKITVNGNQVTPRDGSGNIVEPFIYNGSTYLPVRGVADALGLAVKWDAATSTVMLGESPTANTNWSKDNPAPIGTKIYVDYVSSAVKSLTAKYHVDVQQILRGDEAYKVLAGNTNSVTHSEEKLKSFLKPDQEFVLVKIGVHVDTASANPVSIGIGSQQDIFYSGYGNKLNVTGLINYLPASGSNKGEVLQGTSGYYWRAAVIDKADATPYMKWDRNESTWFKLYN